MKIVVSRNELKAALLFASQDESRYVLNGLLIESRVAISKPTIVATDGRRLVVIETAADQGDAKREDGSILLRADFVKPLCALSKAIGGKNFPWIEFENRQVSKQVSVAFVGSKCHVEVEEGALIEGQYPNWRQILPPKKAERKPINDLGMNSEYVGDFAKAAKIMEASPIIQMNLIGKEQAIEVRLTALAEFYGLIMPCKADESLDYQPEFLAVTKMFPAPEPEEEKPEPEEHFPSE